MVQQFTFRPGVRVKIAIEIQADSDGGFDDGLQRAVKENCNVLRFKNAEFFAGEAKSGSAVNVQVNVDRGGYEFRRPGQRLVDIAPATDVQSSDDADQGIDNAE